MFTYQGLVFAFLLAFAVISKTDGCVSNVDCPHGQCCGSMWPDLLGVLQSCQAYSQKGEGCHGSLIGASCDCEPGLICVEHTGIFAILHTSTGICREANYTEPFNIFGK